MELKTTLTAAFSMHALSFRASVGIFYYSHTILTNNAMIIIKIVTQNTYQRHFP